MPALYAQGTNSGAKLTVLSCCRDINLASSVISGLLLSPPLPTIPTISYSLTNLLFNSPCMQKFLF